MRRHCLYRCSGQAAIEFVGEQQIRQFRLPVGISGRRGRIVGIDTTESVADTADGHHPPCWGREQAIQHQPREGEVAEMVDPELDFEPVLGGTGQSGDTGVVDQQIDPVMAAANSFGGCADRREGRKVQGDGVDRRAGRPPRDALGGVCRLVRIAAGEHNGGAAPCQRSRGVESEPGVGAGNDRDAPGQVGDVGFGPLTHGITPNMNDAFTLK